MTRRFDSIDLLVACCAASAGATICKQFSLAIVLFGMGLLLGARAVSSIVSQSFTRKGGDEKRSEDQGEMFGTPTGDA